MDNQVDQHYNNASYGVQFLICTKCLRLISVAALDQTSHSPSIPRLEVEPQADRPRAYGVDSGQLIQALGYGSVYGAGLVFLDLGYDRRYGIPVPRVELGVGDQRAQGKA